MYIPIYIYIFIYIYVYIYVQMYILMYTQIFIYIDRNPILIVVYLSMPVNSCLLKYFFLEGVTKIDLGSFGVLGFETTPCVSTNFVYFTKLRLPQKTLFTRWWHQLLSVLHPDLKQCFLCTKYSHTVS